MTNGKMMSKSAKHNKKRNVALIYEQLVRYVARSLVEGETEKARTAMGILKEHFKKDSQLYKEFRLFNALLRTTVDEPRLAERILSEARNAAKTHDPGSLDVEKSRLIASINKRLDEQNFFDTKIPEYRDLATVQTLLNEWRKGGSAHIPTVVSYEDKARTILMTEKKLPELIKTDGVNGMTVRVMREKVASKFGDTLNENQLGLVMAFAKNDAKETKRIMVENKKASLKILETFARVNTNQVLAEKIKPVIESVRSLDESSITDDNVARHLLLSRMAEEIAEEERENVR
jgi:hypothetical protein